MSSKKITPNEEILYTDEAADYLRVNISTIRWLRRKRVIPFGKLGRRLYTTKSRLDDYLNANLPKE